VCAHEPIRRSKRRSCPRHRRQDRASFDPGDTLRVNVKIKEGERERVQAYEGLCIARSGGGVNANFTVRKISFGEGVERVFRSTRRC